MSFLTGIPGLYFATSDAVAALLNICAAHAGSIYLITFSIQHSLAQMYDYLLLVVDAITDIVFYFCRSFYVLPRLNLRVFDIICAHSFNFKLSLGRMYYK